MKWSLFAWYKTEPWALARTWAFVTGELPVRSATSGGRDAALPKTGAEQREKYDLGELLPRADLAGMFLFALESAGAAIRGPLDLLGLLALAFFAMF